ncbi:MAG: hypothetical protein ACI9XB_004407, partial [Gammaproteobacteria bacterium]
RKYKAIRRFNEKLPDEINTVNTPDWFHRGSFFSTNSDLVFKILNYDKLLALQNN